MANEDKQTRSIEARGFNHPSSDDRWISIQKKTFQNWANEQLKETGNRVQNLETDFSDGYKLVALMEALTVEDGCQWKRTLGPFTSRRSKSQTRIHQMETVEFALSIMKFEKVDLTNIGASDIVDQNLKLILGLVWKLILKFQIAGANRQQGKARKHLLDLLNTILPDVGGIKNFSSDWNSGIALCALCNYCDPSVLPKWREMSGAGADRENNCRAAISQAESKFRVPQILTPEDMCSPELDEQSGMTYISYFFREDGPAQASLLKWVNSKLPPEQRVRNFGSDWRSGLALCALANAVAPGSCREWQSLDAKDRVNNCNKGLEAGRKLGIEPTITAQEMSAEDANPIAVMTQVAKYQHYRPPANHNSSEKARQQQQQQQQQQPVSNGLVEEEPLVKVKRSSGGQKGLQNMPPSSYSSSQNSPSEHVNSPSPTAARRTNYASPPDKFGGEKTSVAPPAPPPAGPQKGGNIPPSSSNAPASPYKPPNRKGVSQNSQHIVSPAVPREFADFEETDGGDPRESPSAIMELETQSSKLTNGLPSVFIHNQIAYSVRLPVATDLKDISVSIETPSRNRQQAPITSLSKQDSSRALISFTPSEAGKHTINCAVRNLPVKGAPAQVMVLPDASSQLCLQPVSEAVAINHRAEFLIVNTNNSGGGGGGSDVIADDVIKFRCTGPDSKAVNCQQSTDANSAGVQSLKFVFVPKQVGLYNVSASHLGRNVNNSPLICEVFDPNAVKVTGFRDVNAGQPLSITIDTKDAGPGEPALDILHNNKGAKYRVDLRSGSSGASHGLFYGSFKPMAKGLHQAYVYFQHALVHGRPVEFRVSGAGALVKCSGPGLQQGVEDWESSFTVDASRAYKHIDSLQVKVEGPNSLAKCTVSRNKDNTFSATYRPVEVGLYDVTVLADGEPLEGCPYKVNVVNARKVKCTQLYESFMDKDGQVMLQPNKKFSLSFDTSAAGNGELKAKVSGPAGHSVPCSVEKEDKIYTISFLPKSKGKYELSVLFEEQPIPRSPFPGVAKDSFFQDIGPVLCQGEGLKEARVREESQFSVDTSKALLQGDLKMSMSGLHGDIEVAVSKLSENLYSATYTPFLQGMYLLHVTYAERQVQGSPFKVVVYPSLNSQAVQAFGSGLKEGTLGQPIKFGVDARAAGPGILSCSCKGPKKQAEVDVTDNHDGTFSMNIKPKEQGKHVLEIKYDDEHIHNSPYIVKVSGAPDPSKCRVYGPGVEHGVLALFKGDFICDTKGAGAGQLKVRIHGPKGAFKVEMRRDNSRDRTIVVRYNPTDVGDYKIQVWWADVEIPQSPFEVKIFRTEQDLEDFLLEYPNERNKYSMSMKGSVSSTASQQFSLFNGSAHDDVWKADV